MLQEQYRTFNQRREIALEGCRYAEDYASAIISAIDNVKKCTENKEFCLLVMMLVDAYHKVCGITLGRHMGGMTHTGSSATTLLANWDKVVNYFYTAVEVRLGELVDLGRLRKILLKNTECMMHLRSVKLVLRKQEKVTDVVLILLYFSAVMPRATREATRSSQKRTACVR